MSDTGIVAPVVPPSIPGDPGRPPGGRAVPTVRIPRSPAGGLRAAGGSGSAQPQVSGGVCRGRLLRGVRGGPWPRSFLSALWSAVPVRRLARRDMAWEGRPGAAAGAESTGLRRASRSTRATQHRRTPWFAHRRPRSCHPRATSKGQSRSQRTATVNLAGPISWSSLARPARTHPANMPDKEEALR